MKTREELIAMAQIEGKMQEIDLYEKHGGISAYDLNLYRIIVSTAYQEGILKGYELGINDAKELIKKQYNTNNNEEQ